MKTEQVYLLLGSNIGLRHENLEAAIRLLVSRGVILLRQSKIVESEAWGQTDQPAFLNQCIEIETKVTPLILLELCKSVELEVGRKKRKKWMEREIDIDILFFGERQIETSTLTIPHPQLIRRRFALMPLSELAPDLIHPTLQLKISDLLHLCTDELEVKIL